MIVYFAKDFSRFEKVINSIGFLDFIKKGDIVAIKLHIGEKGNKCFLDPWFGNVIAKLVKKRGGKCFFTDTSTYYKKKRHIATDHVFLALEHGFSEVPFIQSDGIYEEGIELKSRGLLSKVYIAKIYEYVDKVIVLTHPTGHGLTAYGGAIKNIGMGVATKKCKLLQHRTVDLVVEEEKCIGCKICVNVCPYNAPVIKNGKRKPEMDKETCMRCPICRDACPQKAIKLVNVENLCRALVSVCYSFINFIGDENIRYINVAKNVSNRCDCSVVSKVIKDDVGFFLSNNIVAVDAATLEKINIDFSFLHKVNPWAQIEEAEHLNLGSAKYELKEV